MLPRLEALRLDLFDPDRDFTLPGLRHKSVFLRVHDDVTLENWLLDLPVYDRPLFAVWFELKELIAKAREIIDPTLGLGRAVFSVIDPGGVIQWHTDLGDYARAHRRFHIPLLTNPECWCYALGDPPIHMMPGELVELDTQVFHSSVNAGTQHRTHFLFELRRGT